MFEGKTYALALVLGIIIISGIVSATTSFRDGASGCQPGETRLYSLAKETNSHAFESDLNGASNVDVCSDKVTGAEVAQTCPGGYHQVIAFNREDNSHVGSISSYSAADYRLCLDGITNSFIRTGGCRWGEETIGRMNRLKNSHIGDRSYSGDHWVCVLPTSPPGPIPGYDVNLTINDNDTWTNANDVTLTVNFSTSNSSRDCYYRNNSDLWWGPDSCPEKNFEKSWSLNDIQGQRYVSILDGLHFTQDNDSILLDSVAPNITCNDCYQLKASNITFNPTIRDPKLGVADDRYPSGFKNMTICGDKSCSKTYCHNSSLSSNNKTSCSYSWSGACRFERDHGFWIRAEDNLGNVRIKRGGSFDIKKGLGCVCSSDLECISGWCYGEPQRLCTPLLAPQIYIG